MSKLGWTHQDVSIKDIRKLNKLYVIRVELHNGYDPINSALFVKDTIFEERLKSYFLKDISQISREEILSVKWNMYITKGHYIKIGEDGTISEHPQDNNKWYVSYLEIAGLLGSFCSIYKEKSI